MWEWKTFEKGRESMKGGWGGTLEQLGGLSGATLTRIRSHERPLAKPSAVLAGVMGIIIATTIVDIALHLAGVFPAPPEPLTESLALLASSYRLVIGVAGGYLTAKLAPGRPLRHALIPAMLASFSA